MKKLLIILLSGIYALSVFGAAPASLFCCEKAAFTESAGIESPVTDTNNGCHHPEQGITGITHHIGAATVHFSFRHFMAQVPAGMASNASAIDDAALCTTVRKIATPISARAVPLYRMHCVYRI